LTLEHNHFAITTNLEFFCIRHKHIAQALVGQMECRFIDTATGLEDLAGSLIMATFLGRGQRENTVSVSGGAVLGKILVGGYDRGVWDKAADPL
jgi:hypothetical protein